jgi:cytochrome c oxidase subunit 2
MTARPSFYADSVDGAMLYIMGICVFLLLGITVVMLYFVWRYHHKKHPKPIQTHGNIWVEATWVVIPTAIVISMFFYGYMDYKVLVENEEYDILVNVRAKKWDWDFTYASADSTFVFDEVVVPVGKTVRFDITSVDVLHSFYLPGFRIKEDAVPGKVGTYMVTPNKTGIFDIACTEYCGQYHWKMYKQMRVVSEDEYAAWLGMSKEQYRKEVLQDKKYPVKVPIQNYYENREAGLETDRSVISM